MISEDFKSDGDQLKDTLMLGSQFFYWSIDVGEEFALAEKLEGFIGGYLEAPPRHEKDFAYCNAIVGNQSSSDELYLMRGQSSSGFLLPNKEEAIEHFW